MKATAKKHSSPSLKRYTFSRVELIIFILIFACIGGYLIYKSFAASGTKAWDTQADFSSGTLSNVTANSNGSVSLSQASTYGLPASIPACTGINITSAMTSQDIQSSIDANPSNTTFCFHAGTYRWGSRITPKSNDKFLGSEPGVIISGSKLLNSNWQTSGSNWVIGGQTQFNNAHVNDSSGNYGVCQDGSNICKYPNDVYYDNQPLTRVTSLGAVAAGKFFFDYNAGNIYIGNNPTGHTVELGVANQFYSDWANGATGVTIKYLTVEKFASDYTGAIEGGSVIENNVIRLNHAAGIHGGDTIRGNNIHTNGHEGLSQAGGPVENNEIAFNNYANYDKGWDAGGLKTGAGGPVHITMRGNYVHDNNGRGLWCDWVCTNSVIEDNWIINNNGIGILYEASQTGIIRNNVITGNANWGIDLTDSGSTEIYGNYIANNTEGSIWMYQDQRTCSNCDLIVHDNNIHDNNIVMSAGQEGAIDYGGGTAIWTTSNNKFSNNKYTLSGVSTPFYWNTGSGSPDRTFAQWQSAGQDTTGSCCSAAGSSPALPPAGGYYSSGVITLNYDAGSVSDWTTITPNESKPAGTNITYQYRSSADNINWSTVSSDINAVPDNRYFQVIATLSTTNSSVSPVINSITLSFNDPSTGDTQLPTSPGNLNVTNKTQTTMKLNWTASTDNVAVHQYTLWRDGTWLGTVPANTLNFTFGDGSGTQPTSNTALTCGQTYNLKVAAYDTSYNMSTQVSVDASTSCAAAIPGDSNGDGHVTQGDLTILVVNFNTSTSFCDFNHDGTVNFLDVSILLSNFGQ